MLINHRSHPSLLFGCLLYLLRWLTFMEAFKVVLILANNMAREGNHLEFINRSSRSQSEKYLAHFYGFWLFYNSFFFYLESTFVKIGCITYNSSLIPINL